MAKIVLAKYLSGGNPLLNNYHGNYWLITCECGEVNRITTQSWGKNGGKKGCKNCGGILDREDAIPAMDNLGD